MTPAQKRLDAAKIAAQVILNTFNVKEFAVAAILGTGWTEALGEGTTIKHTLMLEDIPGFEGLPILDNHPRQLIHAKIAERDVLILAGRIHMNEEMETGKIQHAVRLQTEMLIHCGVKKLIITSAVGSLKRHIKTGDIVVINDFITLFAPTPSVLTGGEFVSPQNAISQTLLNAAFDIAVQTYDGGNIRRGTHVMVPGPHIETYKDKQIVYSMADVIGMSMLPEVLTCAVYSNVAVNFVGLGFVTNGTEQCEHENNIQVAKEKSQSLGRLFINLVQEFCRL